MRIKASYHQERVWLIDQIDSGKAYESGPTYHNIPFILDIEGTLNIDILERSIRAVISRHGALRTRLVIVDNEPVQQIDEMSKFNLQTLHLREDGDNTDDPSADALDAALRYANRPFSLDKDPSVRGAVIPVHENKHLLVMVFHHIIMDKYSLEIIAGELVLHYKAYLEDRSPQLPGKVLNYADFSQWQRNLPDSIMDTLFSYWKRKLEGKLQVLELPTDRPRSSIHTYEAGSCRFHFSQPLGDKIKAFAGQENTHNFVLFLTAFKVLLHRYSGQGEIVLGTALKNRNQPGTGGIVGPVANILPLRSILSGTSSFKELLPGAGKTVEEAHKYQEMPYEKLVPGLKPEGDMSRTAPFDVLFQYGENPPPVHSVGDLKIKYLETNLGWGKYDLNLLIRSHRDNGEFFSGVLVYNKKYYDESTIFRLTGHYKTLLESICNDPLQEISKLPLLTGPERRQLLIDWNRGEARYPRHKTIHGLVAEQAEKNPGNIAVVHENSYLTYGQLNRRANRLARYLRDRYNIRPDTIVGLMMERSLEMITGILAILKSGGAYLPIDPAYPEERINYMLHESGSSLLLTQSNIFETCSVRTLPRSLQASGQAVMTPPRPQITDFDSLPLPDRSMVNYEKYMQYIGIAMVKNSMSLQTTRGCPYNCAYCHKIWPKRHVIRSGENIFAEVQLYYNMGVRKFSFVDDIFNLDIDNSSEFFKQVIRHNYDVQLFFPNGMRGDILTPGYIDLMVQGGTVSLALALETASPRLQKLIKKNLNLEKLRENIEYFTKTHPQVILELFTMQGFPGESEEEARMTLDFIKGVEWFHFPYFHILKIYPNTDMAQLAVKHGISPGAIENSTNLAYHELPDTLPFDKSFTLKCQAEFLNEYFLSKERLLQVLPRQMNILSEDEIVQKYDSYLPVDINSLDDLLKFTGIAGDELDVKSCFNEEAVSIPGLNEKIQRHFPVKKPAKGALKILLIDLSQFFSHNRNMLYDVVDPPLGLMYLLSYLNRELGDKVDGKIVKSRIDFDNYRQLKVLLEEFKPDVIGIRTLTYYKKLFHHTTALIRQWGFAGPVIAGGPYATSDYMTVLTDRNVDIAVIGEGELTFRQLIEAILENEKKLPGEEALKKIQGIALVPFNEKQRKGFARDIVIIDELAEVWSNGAESGLEAVNRPDDAAYIIFTSGSTGKPKGTLVSHRSVVRLLENDKKPFNFYPHDVWTMAHSVCFDFSVWEMYGALFNGGKLIVPTLDTVRDTGEFLEHIKRHCITVLNQTPGAFYNLIVRERTFKEKTMGKHLRCVIFGGDRLQPYYLKEWTDSYPLTAVRLINMYGITETTVHVTYHPLTGEEICSDNQSSPIGKPLPETSLYVLDEHFNLQPIGIPGEICVGGTGLARGYLNRSVETRERFIDNPFKRNGLLYRSGDLGKRLADGNILYLGRIDHQVKIRGFRVELGEIEAQLLTHDEIGEAVVVDREESGDGSLYGKKGDTYLCAYIVVKQDRSIPVSELRDYLAGSLPDYMIPAYFVRLKEIPLTGNGKVDRRSLPQPRLEAGQIAAGPANEIERKLTAIYSRVLGLDDGIIDVDANFFEYGGHSVKAMNLIASIHKELKVKLPINELFIRATVRNVAKYIEEAAAESFTSIPAVEEKEYYVLSSGQKRMYILQQMDRGNTSYNVPIIKTLDIHIDKDKFAAALEKLIARHESLRTSFELVGEVPYQKVHDTASLDFLPGYFKVSGNDYYDEVKKITDDFVKPFDLKQAPLFRTGLINSGENRNILMLDMHHIISDGVSMDIMVEDFLTLYSGLELPGLALQYKDYAEWQNSEEQRRLLKKQEEYWLTVFAGELPLLDLPFDYERPEVKRFQGKLVCFKLGEEETESLRDLAASRNATLYMVLLAAVNILLSKLCHQQDIIVGTYTFGRAHADLRQILGMFINTLAMRNFPGLEKHVDHFLEEVKENTLNAFENQDYQFDHLVEKLAGERSKNRNPVFDVFFGLQNQSDYAAGDSEQGFRYEYGASHFDMVLWGTEVGKELDFNLEYDTQLFKRETIERIIDDFLQIVHSVINDSHIKIKDIQLESELLPLKKVNLDVEFSI